MTMDYENERSGYDVDAREYSRDRSPSPHRPGDSPGGARDRRRSVSPGRRPRDDRVPMSGPDSNSNNQGNGTNADGARNTGTNLFVTGIHPRLTEDDVTRLFQKYGEVEKCQIMVDPHTKESRGFGFVKMATLDQADAAKEGLQGEVYEGRTLSIEKARRSRPRTPTPGKYFGPPKRNDYRRPPPRDYDRRYPPRSYGASRYHDDDRYSSRHDDRGDRYYRSRDSARDDYPPPRGIDRYASSREDRYGARDERGGRSGGYYDRDGGREGGFPTRTGAPPDDRAPITSSSRDYYTDDRRSGREEYRR